MPQSRGGGAAPRAAWNFIPPNGSPRPTEPHTTHRRGGAPAGVPSLHTASGYALSMLSRSVEDAPCESLLPPSRPRRGPAAQVVFEALPAPRKLARASTLRHAWR